MRAAMVLVLVACCSCSAPTLEVHRAEGAGVFVADLEGQRISVQLEASAVDDGRGLSLCTTYRASFAGAEQAGLAPGSDARCVAPQSDPWAWSELVAPVLSVLWRWLWPVI